MLVGAMNVSRGNLRVIIHILIHNISIYIYIYIYIHAAAELQERDLMVNVNTTLQC